MDTREWAKLQQSLLRSQMKVLREFLKEEEEPAEFLPPKKRKRQISIIYDILSDAQKPLHVSEIIAQAKQDFQLDLDRESIASAIMKKVKKGRMFRKAAPNTFAILDSPDSPLEPGGDTA